MGEHTVRSGWDAYCAKNAATIVCEDPTIASLYRSAVTRVALARSDDELDSALIEAVDGSLPQSWPTDANISRRALRDPATARRVAFVVARWVSGANHQAADWPESAAACLSLGATALETLERNSEPIDVAAASWLAQLASELDQPTDTVRAIATAGTEKRSGAIDASDLTSLLLAGWDDHLIERLDRAHHRFGRYPAGFVDDTARPIGPIDHDATSAAVVAMTDAMLCTQWPGGLIEIVSNLPASWNRQPVEVTGIALAMGRLSFALRWHDDRAALLWELDRSSGEPDTLRVRCGLDGGFEGHGDSGEALVVRTQLS
jgi:hypothetical protein